MNLVRDPNDWVCMRDGDTMFMLPNWGHQIKHYIEKYPDTGLFTCYAYLHRNAFIAGRGLDGVDCGGNAGAKSGAGQIRLG